MSRLAFDQVVPPDVAPVHHRHLVIGPSHHDHMLDARRLNNREVGVGLERDNFPAAPCAILGNDDPAVRVENSARQRFGGKPAKHHQVDQAEPGARKHCDREFGDHSHVDRNAIALLEPEALQPVGEPAYFGVEIRISEAAGISWLTHPVVGDLIAM